MKQIFELIREERRKRKLTQAQLGEKVGYCYVTICNLEKGRNVALNVLCNVCKELNIRLIATTETEV